MQADLEAGFQRDEELTLEPRFLGCGPAIEGRPGRGGGEPGWGCGKGRKGVEGVERVEEGAGGGMRCETRYGGLEGEESREGLDSVGCMCGGEGEGGVGFERRDEGW